MENNYEYIQTVRDDITSDILVKADSVASVLNGHGIMYPHLVSSVKLDAIKGENFADLRKELKKYSVKINSKVKNANPLDDEFKLHNGFKHMHKNELINYVPMTLEFDDGQVLMALARTYGEDKDKSNKGSYHKVVKWFLNNEDLSKKLFKTKSDINDDSKIANRISAIINQYHNAFVKENPSDSKELQDLEKELESLTVEEDELIKLVEEKTKADEEKNRKLGLFDIEKMAKLVAISSDNRNDLVEGLEDIKQKATENGLDISFYGFAEAVNELTQKIESIPERIGEGLNIKVVSHEGTGNLDNTNYKSFNDLQVAIRKEYNNDPILFAEKFSDTRYNKYELSITLPNNDVIKDTLYVGTNEEDFNPFTENLTKHLKKDLMYRMIEIENDLEMPQEQKVTRSYTGEVAGENIARVEELLQSYDFTTFAIDDYKLKKETEEDNEYLKTELSKLGVTSFSGAGFEGKETTIELPNIETKPVITPENIAEFYPTMSDEDKKDEKINHILDVLFSQRKDAIFREFFLPSTEKSRAIADMKLIGEKTPLKSYDGVYRETALYSFGVKDKLQPLDQYIEEIKASDEYKAYIASKEPVTDKSNLETILEDEVYKKILEDSSGGIIYDVSNKYDADHLLELWDNMNPTEKESAGGTVRGAMEFLQDQKKSNQPLEEKEALESEFNDIVKNALSITDITTDVNEHKLASLMEDAERHPIGLSEPVKNEELYISGVRKIGNHINELLKNKDYTEKISELLNIDDSAELESKLDELAEELELNGKHDEFENDLIKVNQHLAKLYEENK